MKSENEGWQSERCTRPKCRQALDGGAGNQFKDAEGREQRYCWKHWVEHNYDQKLFKKEI